MSDGKRNSSFWEVGCDDPWDASQLLRFLPVVDWNEEVQAEGGKALNCGSYSMVARSGQTVIIRIVKGAGFP